jgi:predicted MFS family arabinose efflux permease
MTVTVPSSEETTESTMSPGLTFLLALACGLLVANTYYAQPVAGPMSEALGIPRQAAGLIVTMTQLGYGIGLLLIVPLGDLLENRRLITTMIAATAIALLAAAFATKALPFLIAALAIGIFSVAIQIILPYAGHLAPDATRGRVTGTVATGLMLGVMLSRPTSSFIISISSSWRTVYFLSSAGMLVLAIVMRLVLPKRTPNTRLHYGELLLSMVHLALTTPVLQRRALYQALLFGSFSLFWTVTPLYLASEFGLTQRGIGVFALIGVAGVIAAPIAGRLGDAGWTRAATAFAMVAATLAFLITHIGHPGSPLALVLLTLAAVLLDFAVQGNYVLGFRAIFALGAESRSRLNGLYMATFFAAAAAGSAIGSWAFATGGWPLASWIGGALPIVALLYFATE